MMQQNRKGFLIEAGLLTSILTESKVLLAICYEISDPNYVMHATWFSLQNLCSSQLPIEDGYYSRYLDGLADLYMTYLENILKKSTIYLNRFI